MNISSVLMWFRSVILFEKGCEPVALSEFYGNKGHKFIIFMNLKRKCSTCYKL
jgi:hypothetical protein